ncbi:MAG: hypothetical protein KDE23_09935 [Caldilinea sp.]|nr:hypothetical protein [Caldilinea sp.]
MAGAFLVVWENPRCAPRWGAWISIADGTGAGNGQMMDLAVRMVTPPAPPEHL